MQLFGCPLPQKEKDMMPFQRVEKCGFIWMVKTLDQRYMVSSHKYFNEVEMPKLHGEVWGQVAEEPCDSSTSNVSEVYWFCIQSLVIFNFVFIYLGKGFLLYLKWFISEGQGSSLYYNEDSLYNLHCLVVCNQLAQKLLVYRLWTATKVNCWFCTLK